MTYSFTWSAAIIGFFGGSDVSTAAQKARMIEAFGYWSAVTPGIEFVEVIGVPATIAVGTAGPAAFGGSLGLGGGLASTHFAGPDTAANHFLSDLLAVQNSAIGWHTAATLPTAGLYDYLTVAIRHLKRQKGYSFINIMGLTLGMMCCVLILLFIRDELSYATESMWPKFAK